MFKKLSTLFSSGKKQVIAQCPICGNDIVSSRNAYKCLNCKVKLPNTINGHMLTQQDVIDLLNKKVSDIHSVKNEFGYDTFYCLHLQDDNTVKINITKKIVGSCPICGSEFIEINKAYSCNKRLETNSQDCIAMIPKTLGKLWKTSESYILSKEDIVNLLNDKPTDKHNLLDGNGREYVMSFILDHEKGLKVYSAEPIVVGKCPECGKDVYVEENRYACKCEWAFPRIVKGSEVNKQNIQLMLQGKKTEVINFVWKNGKTGKARLYLEGTTLKWEFIN